MQSACGSVHFRHKKINKQVENILDLVFFFNLSHYNIFIGKSHGHIIQRLVTMFKDMANKEEIHQYEIHQF